MLRTWQQAKKRKIIRSWVPSLTSSMLCRPDLLNLRKTEIPRSNDHTRSCPRDPHNWCWNEAYHYHLNLPQEWRFARWWMIWPWAWSDECVGEGYDDVERQREMSTLKASRSRGKKDPEQSRKDAMALTRCLAYTGASIRGEHVSLKWKKVLELIKRGKNISQYKINFDNARSSQF